MEKLYVYETIDGCVGAGIIEPSEDCTIITTKNFTKEQARDILDNGNMSLPISIINNLMDEYL